MNAENRITAKRWKRRLSAAMPWISLAVIITVFWWLKMTGITLAGEAFCGMTEHSHSPACAVNCPIAEHTHTAACYPNVSDDETREEWEATLPAMDENTSVLNRILFVACSQIGYKESTQNFKVDENLVCHGYTRYGDWYGNPYGDWSTMFVSFCLHYAGMTDLPSNSGAEVMKLDWDFNGRFATPSTYTPQAGDVVFLDKNYDGRVDTSAIFLLAQSNTVSVIEGDLEGEVRIANYPAGDRILVGYGISAPSYSLIVKPNPAPTVNTTPAYALPPVMSESESLQTVAKDQQAPLSAKPQAAIAKTSAISSSTLTNSANAIVIYTQYGNDYYAIDGEGNAVPITVSGDIIKADVDNADALYWKFSGSKNYTVKNVATGANLKTLVSSNSDFSFDGNKIKTGNNYLALNADTGKLTTAKKESASTFYVGVASDCYIWLDGTGGGIMSLGGSPNLCNTVKNPSSIQLPSEWESPTKYAYKLQGWYDVNNGVYYPAGAYIEVTGNTVFYADWVAATYDIGEFNTSVTNSISTNHIITTRVFDYNFLFNVLSQNATVSINGSSSHSETWSHVASGNVKYKNQPTIDFIFSDNDSSGKISMANNRNDDNKYSADVPVKSGILTPELIEIVFGTENSFDPSTGTGIIGKNYLGTGDYLLQYMDDPNHEFFGYYYYDASLNAASYNQSDQRFYVYNYLSRSSDSSNANDQGKYSDFLPLNSPYANTNGQTVKTYTYDGTNGEYEDVNHYQYDARYNTNSTSTDLVSTNFAFGMSMEMKFYLPDAPGSLDENGNTGNRDLYGNDMIYYFSGDDDLWIVIDGEVILDLGGIHQSQNGIINFSTGIVTVNGAQTNTIYHLGAGEHTFVAYYLDRGSSLSNCAMYFNITPRFGLDISKEDVLTCEQLDGAEFTVYTDRGYTTPAVLWESQEAYEAGMPSQSTFRVTNGVAKMWGLSPGKTYYIRETRPPDAQSYDRAEGVICLSLDISAGSSLEPVISAEALGGKVSGGYTVHGYEVDTTKQGIRITVTNGQNWIREVTSIQAIKVWNDKKDHSGDQATVFLSVKNADGSFRRIREVVLNAQNNWSYVWTNLPKYAADGTTPIEYRVEEAYVEGYFSTVDQIDATELDSLLWMEAYEFRTDQPLLLKTPLGYLSAESASSGKIIFINESDAREEYGAEDSLATWTASAFNGETVRLVNSAGQKLAFNTSGHYFYLTTGNDGEQNISVSFDSTEGIVFYVKVAGRWNQTTTYYAEKLNTDGSLQGGTDSSNSLKFNLIYKGSSDNAAATPDICFKITNTPLDQATSLTVTKNWDCGLATNITYNDLSVTIKLFSNGKYTGRTVTLSAVNAWTATFSGLPYADENGVPFVYTIEEIAINDDWKPIYSEVTRVSGATPTYKTTVTNVYRYGESYVLPDTGGIGGISVMLCGLALMAGSLVCGCVLKLKRKD